jgi:hypothetical protein
VLQKMFMSDMALLNQNYACLWTKEHVDEWAIQTEKTSVLVKPSK